MDPHHLNALEADMLQPGHIECDSCADGVRELIQEVRQLQGAIATEKQSHADTRETLANVQIINKQLAQDCGCSLSDHGTVARLCDVHSGRLASELTKERQAHADTRLYARACERTMQRLESEEYQQTLRTIKDHTNVEESAAQMRRNP